MWRQLKGKVQADNSTTASSLVPIQPAGSRSPLFCIAGVAGGVSVFRILAKHLGTDQPLYGLQPPEPDGKRPALLTVPDIARHYIQEIRAAQPQGPYFLAGFSFGGLVAFEIASLLREQGQSTALLIMFDSDLSKMSEEVSTSERIKNRWEVYRFHCHHFLFGPERASHLKTTIQGKCAKLVYRMYEVVGRPVPPSVAALGRINDIQTFASYNYSPPVYPGRVTLFRCHVRRPGEKLGYDLGWGKTAAGGLEIYDVPSDHHTMWMEPCIDVVIKKLESCLEEARNSARTQRDANLNL
jgi:thioesterase domain-containing protein